MKLVVVLQYCQHYQFIIGLGDAYYESLHIQET